jgi:hypothetical protein
MSDNRVPGANPPQAKLHLLHEMVAALVADNNAAIEALKSGRARTTHRHRHTR